MMPFDAWADRALSERGAPSPTSAPDQGLERPAPAADAPGVIRPLAFDAVLQAHEVELYRYLRRLAPTAEDAADMHQETFLRAFRAYDALPPGANVRAWLYRIAGNIARDAYRRRSVRAATAPLRTATATRHAPGGGEHPEPSAGPASDPHVRAAAAELRAAVRDALLRLGARQRAAVVARVLEGAPYDEVAAILDCSQDLARQHVSQGLRRLRASLADRLEVSA
jgi:RNA polymerase sigma-70 factor (ECF subfamily)